jgi:hypothetical protein
MSKHAPHVTASPDPSGRGEDPLPDLLARPIGWTEAVRTEPPPSLPGVAVTRLLALTEEGLPVVRVGVAGLPATAVARSTVPLHGAHVGRDAVVVFEGGDPGRPIVLGVLGPSGIETPPAGQDGPVELDVDGRRLLVTASEELQLRCGKASIVLARDGKVTIDGTAIVSRATGVHRIKGGSVQLN